jgi:hypothetical protein
MQKFNEYPIHEGERGRRHPLAAMLALARVALLCGYQAPYAISQSVDNYGKRYLPTFGFSRDELPGQATWYRVLDNTEDARSSHQPTTTSAISQTVGRCCKGRGWPNRWHTCATKLRVVATSSLLVYFPNNIANMPA